MAQTLTNTSVLALALLAGAQAAAAPNLSGLWRGDLGVLRLETKEGRVTAHYESGGECRFIQGQRVMEAEFEGNVLVGKVSLCQQGAACTEKVYSMLAFYNSDDGSLSAHIRLDPGCHSPALKNERLLVISPPDEGSPERPNGSAAQLARRKLSRRSAELAEKHFKEGMRLLRAGDFRGARAEYERGLTYNEDNYAAYNLLGVTQMKLDNPAAALDAYRKASLLKGDDPVIYYNMACAWSRLKDRTRALESLKTALRYGFGRDPSDANAMTADKDLTALLANDPEYKALLDEVWNRSDKAKRGQ